MANSSGQQPHAPSANGQQPIAQQLALIASKRQQAAQQPTTQSVPHQPVGQHQKGKWTGFSGKTLWDWLQLLGIIAIPVVVALVSVLFSMQQDASNQQQHRIDLQIAQQQHDTDLKISQDQQQEATLNTYLDDISSLLLNEHLRTSQPGDEVRVIARVKTFTALRRLDAERKAVLMHFLSDASLIEGKHVIIDLTEVDLAGVYLVGVDLNRASMQTANLAGTILAGANLKDADLNDANLNHAVLFLANMDGIVLNGGDLTRANLTGAQLVGAILGAADLVGANLTRAKLNGVTLIDATLTGDNLANDDLSDAWLNGANLTNVGLVNTNLKNAELVGTKLVGANLTNANLIGADLTNANLSRAIITSQQLAEAYSLKGAIMPDGSRHP